MELGVKRLERLRLLGAGAIPHVKPTSERVRNGLSQVAGDCLLRDYPSATTSGHWYRFLHGTDRG